MESQGENLLNKPRRHFPIMCNFMETVIVSVLPEKKKGKILIYNSIKEININLPNLRVHCQFLLNLTNLARGRKLEAVALIN